MHRPNYPSRAITELNHSKIAEILRQSGLNPWKHAQIPPARHRIARLKSPHNDQPTALRERTRWEHGPNRAEEGARTHLPRIERVLELLQPAVGGGADGIVGMVVQRRERVLDRRRGLGLHAAANPTSSSRRRGALP